MTERVHQRPHTISVELVGDRLPGLAAGLDGTLKHHINVRDVQHDAYRRPAERGRSAIAHLVVLIRQHDHGVAYPDLRVSNPSLRVRHAHHLGRTEGTPVVIDRSGGAIDDEVGRRGVIPIRNWFDCHGCRLLCVTGARSLHATPGHVTAARRKPPAGLSGRLRWTSGDAGGYTRAKASPGRAVRMPASCGMPR